MTAVLLFAKAPRPGVVKTRLAAEIGTAAALEAYRCVGRRVVEQVGTSYPITVWYDPPDALSEVKAWLGEHEFAPQDGADLGARLSHAFSAHLDRGDRPVIAIGADAPGVTAETIQGAVLALTRSDVVIGPALDGGYYLIGVTRLVPELFVGIPWGTADVLEVTVEACRRHHLRLEQLAPLRDLDTAADWRDLGLAHP